MNAKVADMVYMTDKKCMHNDSVNPCSEASFHHIEIFPAGSVQRQHSRPCLATTCAITLEVAKRL